MEKKNNTIQVSDAALAAINGLQHTAGTYHYYRATLDRIFNTVLHVSEDLGMDDMEAVAGPVARRSRLPEASDEIAENAADTFTSIDDIQNSNYPKPEDEAVEGGLE